MIKNIFSRYALMINQDSSLNLSLHQYVKVHLLLTIWLLVAIYCLAYLITFIFQAIWLWVGLFILLMIVYVWTQFFFSKKLVNEKFEAVNVTRVMKAQRRFDIKLVWVILPFVLGRLHLLTLPTLILILLLAVGYYLLQYLFFIKTN